MECRPSLSPSTPSPLFYNISAWIGSLYLACGYALSPFNVYLVDRFGHRITAFVGSLSGLLGFFLASFSPKLWMMYPTYGLLSGFGHRTIYNSTILIVLQHFQKWRWIAIGLITSAVSIAMFAMTLFTHALLRGYGWQVAVRGFGCLYFVCALCSAMYLPITETEKDESEKEKAVDDEEQDCRSSLLRNRSFSLFALSNVVVVFSYYVPFVHIVSYSSSNTLIQR